jgi:hypothetical protein
MVSEFEDLTGRRSFLPSAGAAAAPAQSPPASTAAS